MNLYTEAQAVALCMLRKRENELYQSTDLDLAYGITFMTDF